MQLPAPQQESGVVALDGKVYIVGGLGVGFALMAEVNRFDPVSGQWTAVRPLPRPLHHVNVAAAGGKLYAIGNLEGGNFTARGDTLEYDPSTDQWTARAPLPTGTERGGSAVGVIGGEVFIAGGLRNGSAVTQFSAYNPGNNQHRMLPPLPMATEHVVGGAVGTRFFVIGGRNGGIRSVTNRVQVFDTTTDQWSAGPDLPTARGGHAAAVVDARIVVMGGEGNPAASTGVFSQTEIFDTSSMTWVTGAPMATPRHGMGAATVGNVVYVPGGGTSEGLRPVATVEAYVP
jgi:N-acetylneuraminic acid mutarotase